MAELGRGWPLGWHTSLNLILKFLTSEMVKTNYYSFTFLFQTKLKGSASASINKIIIKIGLGVEALNGRCRNRISRE